MFFFVIPFQFSGENSDNMKSAYGEFCSKHMESVELYKVRNMTEPRDTLYLAACRITLSHVLFNVVFFFHHRNRAY